MAWRTPRIVLSREAVAHFVNPDFWPRLNIVQRQRIASLVSSENGDQALAMALAQGNPNLTNIQIESDFPLQA